MSLVMDAGQDKGMRLGDYLITVEELRTESNSAVLNIWNQQEQTLTRPTVVPKQTLILGSQIKLFFASIYCGKCVFIIDMPEEIPIARYFGDAN